MVLRISVPTHHRSRTRHNISPESSLATRDSQIVWSYATLLDRENSEVCVGYVIFWMEILINYPKRGEISHVQFWESGVHTPPRAMS